MPEWKYKSWAIRTCAKELRESLNPEFLKVATFVPIPPSRAAIDPMYDDRMLQVCRLLGDSVDVRDLVYQEESMESAHATDDRPDPQHLYANYHLRDELLEPPPHQIAVVDDVLTTGAHFVAMKRILSEAFPETDIVGLFVARRVPENVVPEA